MIPVEPGNAREFLEAIIAAFSVLGGVMAYYSGYAGYQALAQDQPPSSLAHEINQGIGEGFALGVPAAIMALMIMGWGW